jgi:hypothetical protein
MGRVSKDKRAFQTKGWKRLLQGVGRPPGVPEQREVAAKMHLSEP